MEAQIYAHCGTKQSVKQGATFEQTASKRFPSDPRLMVEIWTELDVLTGQRSNLISGTFKAPAAVLTSALLEVYGLCLKASK